MKVLFLVLFSVSALAQESAPGRSEAFEAVGPRMHNLSFSPYGVLQKTLQQDEGTFSIQHELAFFRFLSLGPYFSYAWKDHFSGNASRSTDQVFGIASTFFLNRAPFQTGWELILNAGVSRRVIRSAPEAGETYGWMARPGAGYHWYHRSGYNILIGAQLQVSDSNKEPFKNNLTPLLLANIGFAL